MCIRDRAYSVPREPRSSPYAPPPRRDPYRSNSVAPPPGALYAAFGDCYRQHGTYPPSQGNHAVPPGPA
eukprot:3185498-Amphidinium_carterae.1